jgi:hypothetical protein
MRTADESHPPGDGDTSAQLGGGFGEDITPDDLADSYGSDLDYDDEPSADDADTTSEILEDHGVDEETVEDLSESEAEDVLVDIAEAEGYSTGEAEDLLDQVQEDTGMSATELLEDFVDYYEPSADDSGGALGFDGSGLGSEADSVLAEEPVVDGLDVPSGSDLDLNHDGRITPADAHEAHSAFDLDADG